ncbi:MULTISPECIES: MBL fold metallo-hydrolase [Microbacterium]|uniref:MBL fold metallo-hydrolase n=1 Tax=Microbacterium wangchenii TaxID=2541726 RepID=A0ABX5STX7_9MICO|nr:MULTISPECIES: MBL fold metallo-hydrolase [Microbacterium]MCK6067423.1 MBL fold metallo-hydrolase [Microbacterium sp. EYE_512]QBR89640.1 MBL fold metallo-hydrolase [Microbacterium wangchenii]TXK16761.1 MBL fold metallo-hydrolase [Microbacterium wangchenii]
MTRNPDGVFPVAEGVLRISRAAVNCYLIDADDGPVLVDAGLPRTWPLLRDALSSIGRAPDDLAAVYLTHGHFDHVGMCDRLWHDHHVPVHVHDKDVALARHPYRYAHERPRLTYPVRYPGALPVLARMVAAGALGVHGIDAQGDVRPGEVPPLPGGLIPVASPGHTYGHCAFHLPDRGLLFSGDALVTYDPYTGRTGPRVVARAATADADAALAALDALAATAAGVVLPGHGEPFRQGAADAAAHARAVGID